MSRSDAQQPRWISGASEASDVEMTEAGFRRVRALFQMRRPLPVEQEIRDATRRITTRPFDPRRDTGGFLAVNNRAFSWHPDQGGWSAANLAERMAEPWFDADGFLIHESETGAIDGFCWTKVHPPTDLDPELGEIYVIAADPSTHGTGLGRALTVAGLEHLAGLGIGVGMLYVEHDNDAAVSLYRKLGFEIHHTDALYEPVESD